MAQSNHKPCLDDSAVASELEQLIDAEIEALNAPGNDEPSQADQRQQGPIENGPGDSGISDAESDFVEFAAAWLCRRPQKVLLLQRLCRLVLGDAALVTLHANTTEPGPEPVSAPPSQA
jgi:hypothetical protein